MLKQDKDQWDSLVGRHAWLQSWQPEFETMMGGENGLPERYSMTLTVHCSTCASPEHMQCEQIFIK